MKKYIKPLLEVTEFEQNGVLLNSLQRVDWSDDTWTNQITDNKV